MEAVTKRELNDLGYTDLRVEEGVGILFRGDSAAVAKCNICLRTAERVFVLLGQFRAVTFEELFQGVKAIPWGDILPEDAEFPVTGKSVKSGLFSVPDCQAITKKAIVEKLKEKYNRQIFPETGVKYKIEVSIRNDIVRIVLDTSGDGLHKRGYRRIVGNSPIKETLACSLILLSYWKEGRMLVDPLCGTGTIPIEAAMIARNQAPGLRRSFIAEKYGIFNRDAWAHARAEAFGAINNDCRHTVFGSDLDPKCVELAQLHAKEARVENFVTFKQMNVLDLASKEKYGFIITNPPYGERVGELRAVEKLYGQMGRVFSALDTWSYYIITSHPSFERLFGRKADKRRKLYNGALQCQYYQYLGPKPPKAPKDGPDDGTKAVDL